MANDRAAEVLARWQGLTTWADRRETAVRNILLELWNEIGPRGMSAGQCHKSPELECERARSGQGQPGAHSTVAQSQPLFDILHREQGLL